MNEREREFSSPDHPLFFGPLFTSIILRIDADRTEALLQSNAKRNEKKPPNIHFSSSLSLLSSSSLLFSLSIRTTNRCAGRRSRTTNKDGEIPTEVRQQTTIVHRRREQREQEENKRKERRNKKKVVNKRQDESLVSSRHPSNCIHYFGWTTARAAAAAVPIDSFFSLCSSGQPNRRTAHGSQRYS